jgi:hypothetical protein
MCERLSCALIRGGGGGGGQLPHLTWVILPACPKKEGKKMQNNPKKYTYKTPMASEFNLGDMLQLTIVVNDYQGP